MASSRARHHDHDDLLMPALWRGRWLHYRAGAESTRPSVAAAGDDFPAVGLAFGVPTAARATGELAAIGMLALPR